MTPLKSPSYLTTKKEEKENKKIKNSKNCNKEKIKDQEKKPLSCYVPGQQNERGYQSLHYFENLYSHEHHQASSSRSCPVRKDPVQYNTHRAKPRHSRLLKRIYSSSSSSCFSNRKRSIRFSVSVSSLLRNKFSQIFS